MGKGRDKRQDEKRGWEDRKRGGKGKRSWGGTEGRESEKNTEKESEREEVRERKSMEVKRKIKYRDRQKDLMM